ncbi:hypothetical protein [Aquibacillus saliphilus]|nr:hypothetical protein [Aquibacillus saliphilus]
MLERSISTIEVLRIANDLETDSNYTKEDAAQDLLKLLEIQTYI